MASSGMMGEGLRNFVFDFGHDPRILGRLKLPYKTFNFLALLSRGVGADKYDRAVEIIELCQWMYSHISDIRNIINRLSEYVITDLVIDDTNTKLSKDQQETLLRTLDHIGLKYNLIEIAKHYYATGNAFVSIETRFKKHLKCPKCTKYVAPIDRVEYQFVKRDVSFNAKCPLCGFKGKMDVLDISKRTPENVRIKIWDWHNIDFSYNQISDEYKYYYKIPASFVEKLNRGIPDRHLLETTPQEILKEIFSNKKTSPLSSYKGKVVGFKHKKLKHLKNPSIMDAVMDGWGEPITVGVMQDAFFMLLLRQAQGVLLTDYILPVRIVSPDPKAPEFFDLSTFAKNFDQLYDSFQRDPMQIMRIPFPIQYQTLTGEAKQLFLSNEMDYTRQAIRRGIGLPSELLDGGIQNYSGGSISLRMLENYFINFLNNIVVGLVNNFIIPNVCVILGIPPFIANFAKFKMIDDVQQKQSMLELWDRSLISDTAIWERYGVDKPSEKELLETIERKAKRDKLYQLAMAEVQAEGASLLAESQIKDQFKMNDMQEKEDRIKKMKASAQNPDPTKQQSDLSGNPQAVMTPTGDTLPPVEELGDYAMAQLQTPEELDNFMGEIENSIGAGNKEYVDKLKSYIQTGVQNANVQSIQQDAQQTMEGIQNGSDGGGSKKSGGNKEVNRNKSQSVPEQKPQRRNNQV